MLGIVLFILHLVLVQLWLCSAHYQFLHVYGL